MYNENILYTTKKERKNMRVKKRDRKKNSKDSRDSALCQDKNKR